MKMEPSLTLSNVSTHDGSDLYEIGLLFLDEILKAFLFSYAESPCGRLLRNKHNLLYLIPRVFVNQILKVVR